MNKIIKIVAPSRSPTNLLQFSSLHMVNFVFTCSRKSLVRGLSGCWLLRSRRNYRNEEGAAEDRARKPIPNQFHASAGSHHVRSSASSGRIGRRNHALPLSLLSACSTVEPGVRTPAAYRPKKEGSGLAQRALFCRRSQADAGGAGSFRSSARRRPRAFPEAARCLLSPCFHCRAAAMTALSVRACWSAGRRMATVRSSSW